MDTTVEIIDFLGGNQAVAEMLGTHHKAVANWRYFEFFPANTYLAIKKVLRRRGRSAPDSLWAMRPLVQSPPRNRTSD
jgi:hypothetical protein